MTDQELKEIAAGAMNTQRLSESLKALKQIKDQRIIEEIALSDIQHDIRREAIGRVKDPNILEKIIKENSWTYITECAKNQLSTILNSIRFIKG